MFRSVRRPVPAAQQTGSDDKLALLREPEAALVPQCGCVAATDRWLSSHNGVLGGYLHHPQGKIPTLFCRRADPDGRAPPLLLPRFCPFCGQAYTAA